jgi:hypothetical protein
MEKLMMDHDEAVRLKATERYLLDEFNSEQREQFEEHLFDCQECAMDVRAGAMFVEQAKVVLAEKPATEPKSEPGKSSIGWFAWLRPALALPVFALLLAVIGYQSLVQVPHLQEAANRPHIGPAVAVNFGTRGSSTTQISIPRGQGFAVLFSVVSLPQDKIASYATELYNPAGKMEWSGTIPKSEAEEGLQISVAASDVQAGKYTLAIKGITTSGESSRIDPETIDVEVQN